MALTVYLTGTLTRVGPNELICSDAEALRKIASARSLYQRGDFYDSAKLSADQNNLFSTRDDEAHNAMKVKLAAGVSLHSFSALTELT